MPLMVTNNIVERGISYFGFRLYALKEDFEEDFKTWCRVTRKEYGIRFHSHLERHNRVLNHYEDWVAKVKAEHNIQDKDIERFKREEYKLKGIVSPSKPSTSSIPRVEIFLGSGTLLYEVNQLEKLIKTFTIIEISEGTYQELKEKLSIDKLGFFLLDIK